MKMNGFRLLAGFSLSVVSALSAFGTTGVTTNGTEVTVNVDENGTYTYADVLDATCTQFNKTGKGTLVMASDNSSFTGEVEIREGVAEMQHRYAFGNPTESAAKTGAKITVSEGAQLFYNLPGVGQTTTQFFKRIVLKGTGPDGKGALTFKIAPGGTSGNQDRSIGSIELAGDATIGATANSRFGIYNICLNGHELTMAGSGSYMFNGTTFHDDGTIRLAQSKTLTFQGTPEFKTTGGTFVVDSSATFYLYSGNHNIPWTVRCLNKATLKTNGAADAKGRNTFAGPVVLEGDTTLTGQSATSTMTITGKVSGSGKIAASTLADIRIENTENDFTGTVTISSGVMTFVSPGTLPNYATLGRVTVSGGEFRLPVGEGGWDDSTFKAAGEAATVKSSGKIVAWTANNVDATLACDFLGKNLYHGGDGALTFTGALRDDTFAVIGNAAGTFTLSGLYHESVSNLQASAGTLILQDRGYVHQGWEDETSGPWFTSWKVGGTGVESDRPARLVLKGNTALGVRRPAGSSSQVGMTVNETATQGAILELHDGAVLTNTVSIGTTNGEIAKGAVHLYGGCLYNNAINGNDTYFGRYNNNYGYVGIYGGTLEYRSYFCCAYDQKAVGVLDMTGGAYKNTGSGFYIGRGGLADYHLSGGTLTASSDVTVGGQYYANKAATDAQAVLTLAGPGAPEVNVAAGHLYVNQRTNGFTSVVNLNAGSLKAKGICWSTTYVSSRVQSTTKGYLNCGGGTAVAAVDNQNFFGSGGSKLDQVTFFCGGLRFDTDGHSVAQSAATPFVKPAGRGIASIALPASVKSNGKYIGAPEVVISGGGGTGATAHALYDPLTMSVTNIVVTCPGWNYTSAPTVTIPAHERTNNFFTCTATLTPADEDQPGGGFTKAGAGTFTLNAANTYTGPTVLEAGTLVVGAAGALPEGTTIVPKGGTLESTAANFPSEVRVDVSALDPEGRSVPFVTFTDAVPATLPKVTVVGSSDPNWRVRVAGKSLKVGCSRGSLTFLR